MLGLFANELKQQGMGYKAATYTGLSASQLSTHTVFYMLSIFDVKKSHQSLIDQPIAKRVFKEFKEINWIILDELS